MFVVMIIILKLSMILSAAAGCLISVRTAFYFKIHDTLNRCTWKNLAIKNFPIIA